MSKIIIKEGQHGSTTAVEREHGFVLSRVQCRPLYKKTSTGAIQQWVIETVKRQGYPIVVKTTWGQIDGKKQVTEEEVLEGKNIGKKNETTPWEQAVSQMDSQQEKRLKKGYVHTVADAQEGKVDSSVIKGGIPPMLAHKYWEQGKKIKFPALLQPKLDGHRCIAQEEHDDITSFYSLWSRSRKKINSVPHISQGIKNVLRKIDSEINFYIRFLDGELYNHAYKDNFEDLTSLIRQDEPKSGHEAVQYHVYDIPNDELTNFERYELLENLRPHFEGTPVHIVETIVVNNHEELMEAYEYFMELGYEGAMVRNADGMYKEKKSYDLQKVKKFDDDEFIITDVKVQTKGKMKGKAVFICETAEGNRFDAKMKGELESLKQYADDPSLAIGRQLTVQFQGYTKKNNVPRFPVALRFREDI